MMRHIEATLAAGPYLLGERFTAAVLGGAAWIDAYLAQAERTARRRAVQRNDDNGMG